MKKIKITMINLKTRVLFDKYFDTEFERDKFLRRSRFFKNVKVITTYRNIYD